MKLSRWTVNENDILYDNWEYFTNNKEIAVNIFNRSWDAIRTQAYSIKVKLRINYSMSNPAILNEARDYIDGLMLSDGNIHCEISTTGYYQQPCKEKCWLDMIKKNLYEFGIVSRIDNGRLITGGFSPKSGSFSYKLQSSTCIEFKEMHDRWYKRWYDIDSYNKYFWHKDEDGEYFIWQKIIPKDICLSPVCLANEYLGDGSITKQTRAKGYNIQLSTQGFLIEDIIFLSNLLSEVLDIKCGIDKRGVIFITNKTGVSMFLNYIKDYKVECYDYKFKGEEIK